MSKVALPQQFTIQDRAHFSKQWVADRLTMLDIAIINGGGLAEMIDETTKSCPEFRMISARTIKGTVYKQLVRTKLPTTGFRWANEGSNTSKGEHIERMVTCHVFDPRWECDKAVADAAEEGAEAVITEEANATIESAVQNMGRQFYYGLGNDPKGCPGMIELFNAADMEIDVAGGTTAQRSSVWGLNLTADQIQWAAGAGGNLGFDPEVRIGDIIGKNGKHLTGYIGGMTAHIGLVLRDLRAAGRIKGLTNDTNKKLTDDLLVQLWAKYPAGKKPTAWMMNMTQLLNLRDSRKTDLITDPPIPTESHGIPIVLTESIIDGHAMEQV